MKIEIPRYSAMKVVDGIGLSTEFICVEIPISGHEPNAEALAVFSGRDEATRFIATHELTDWVPAFFGYRELHEWLTCCEHKRVSWAVINFHNCPRLEFVKSFRIADAIAAVEAADAMDLDTGDPIFVEGQSLMI